MSSLVAVGRGRSGKVCLVFRLGWVMLIRVVVAPSALQEFLKRLDGLLGLPDYSNTISPGASETSDDMTNVVRQFACRNEMYVSFVSFVLIGSAACDATTTRSILS